MFAGAHAAGDGLADRAGSNDDDDIAHGAFLSFDSAASSCLPWSWSSVTFSSHSTLLPSSDSWIAMWVIVVAFDAPCQCFSFGPTVTTSPGRISSICPPQRW